MAILLVQLVTRSQRRSSAGISNTIALRKLGTRNCPCLNRFLSLKAPPLAAGIFYFPQAAFVVEEGCDPEGIYLVTTVDIADTDEVIAGVGDRLVELQVDEGLSVSVTL